MTNFQNIYIFKTARDVKPYEEEVRNVMRSFSNKIRWTTDLEDKDKILKVETNSITCNEIIKAMTDAGFYCEELNW